MKSFVNLIAYNKDKKILLQHRDADASRNPNKWDLFGGGIEGQETPEQALARELLEELELVLTNISFYKTNILVEGGEAKVRHYFIADLNKTKEELLINLHEGQGLDWFSFDEIKKVELVLHHRQIMNEFINGFDLLGGM